MAWIAAVLQAAGSLYSGSQADQAAKKAAAGQQGLINAQTNQINTLLPYQQSLLQTSQSALQPAVSYWMKALTGDRATLNQLYAPEISRVNQGYNQTLQSSQAQSPRSGASSAYMASLPFQRMQDINSMMINGRAQAAGTLGNLGLGVGSQAAGVGGTINGAANSAMGANNGLLSMYTNQSNQAGQGFGTAMNNLGNYLQNYYGNNSGNPSQNAGTSANPGISGDTT